MSEQWDGRPQNPERDGWHWLQYGSDKPVPTLWISQIWANGPAYSPQGIVELGYRYLCPCHTPAEVAALVEAARRAGLDEAACIVERVAIRGTDHLAIAIRARGDA